jgi:hypothetical protein
MYFFSFWTVSQVIPMANSLLSPEFHEKVSINIMFDPGQEERAWKRGLSSYLIKILLFDEAKLFQLI